MFYDFITKHTEIFFVEKMRKAFALQRLLTFFSTKNIGIFENETLTNDVVSFEQPGPDLYLHGLVSFSMQKIRTQLFKALLA